MSGEKNTAGCCDNKLQRLVVPHFAAPITKKLGFIVYVDEFRFLFCDEAASYPTKLYRESLLQKIGCKQGFTRQISFSFALKPSHYFCLQQRNLVLHCYKSRIHRIKRVDNHDVNRPLIEQKATAAQYLWSSKMVTASHAIQLFRKKRS